MQTFLAPEKEPLNYLQALIGKDPIFWGAITRSGPVLVIQKWQWGDKSLRSAPRGSFPEAASHFKCYDNQGRSPCKRSQLSILHPGLPQWWITSPRKLFPWVQRVQRTALAPMAMSQDSALYAFCWVVINVDTQSPLLLCLGNKTTGASLLGLQALKWHFLLGKMN